MAQFKKAAFFSGFGAGVLFSASVISMSGQTVATWFKREVVPVIEVKPEGALFVPVDGASFGALWSKKEVTPVIAVRPYGAVFVPSSDPTSMYLWHKDDVRPTISVKPLGAQFVPESGEFY